MFKIPQAELWPTPPEVPRLTNKHLQQKLGEEGKKLVFTVTNMGTLLLPNQKVCGVDGVDKQNASVLE